MSSVSFFLPPFFLLPLLSLTSMIYEPSGLYEIVMHEKDELGNGNFGYVLTLERIVELCACFGGQIGSHVYSL